MKKFFITAFCDYRNPTLVRGLNVLEKFPSLNFSRAQDVDDADILLYMEHGYLGLVDLPLLVDRVRRFPAKAHFVYSESDWPYPILPGAYPSLSRQYQWAHSWSYLPNLTTGKEASGKTQTEKTYLFSFLGRVNTHPVRQKIRFLNAAETPCMDLGEAPSRIRSFDYTRSYFDLIRATKFVLCPRGFGPSSIRIFEAMSCGRVPVIISDKWLPPPGIDWERCSISVRERDVASIPTMLKQLEDKAGEMGEQALCAYLKLFAPDVFFDQLLLSISSRYFGASFSTKTIASHVLKALDRRALWTFAHQVRAGMSAIAMKPDRN